MPTYGYNRSITRVAVNPRLAFGVPLHKLCSEGRLHPGLRDLFLKAHLCADTEASFRRKKNQPDWNLDAAHVVLKLLESGEHGLGMLAERLSLKTRLEAGEWIVATPTSPGAPLWVLEHFLGCLPNPIFGEKHWEQLSEECKECVEKAVIGSPNTCSLIQKLAKYLKQLNVGEFLTVAALLGLMRNLATDDRTKDLNKTAVMALVHYFIPSLVSRPYRPGLTSSEDRQKYPLLLFLCYYWPEIREACENLSKESFRASRSHSLANIQLKATKLNQKKCMSLPNNGMDKQRVEFKKTKQDFDKFSLPSDIPDRCIYWCRSKPNYLDIKHQPGCIWKPIFLERGIDDPSFFDSKSNAFKPASLFICTCCGKCCEKVDQETQCDDNIPLHHSEGSENHVQNNHTEFEHASKSSSVRGNCGSMEHTLDSKILNGSNTSMLSGDSTFCSCSSLEGENDDTFHQNASSQLGSMPYLFNDFQTSSTDTPFYTEEAASEFSLDDNLAILTQNMTISTQTEKSAAPCTSIKDDEKDIINMKKLSDEMIAVKNGVISENSMNLTKQDCLNNTNDCNHTSAAFEQTGINPKLTESPSCKSTMRNETKCEVPFAGMLPKPLSKDSRCHTEYPILQSYWEKPQESLAQPKYSAEKSNTYPLQSSSFQKDAFAAPDEHPRRSSESSALPRIKKLRFKPKQWLREAVGYRRIKRFSRTSSDQKPDASS